MAVLHISSGLTGIDGKPLPDSGTNCGKYRAVSQIVREIVDVSDWIGMWYNSGVQRTVITASTPAILPFQC